MLVHRFRALAIFTFFAASFLSAELLASQNPESVVRELQNVPEYWPFCSDANWEIDDSQEGVKKGIRDVFAPELARLLLWKYCKDPIAPRPLPYTDNLHWDFRYGTRFAVGALSGLKVKQIRSSKEIGRHKSSVVVEYEYGNLTGLWTQYTLSFANDQWKIDDIALKGYKTSMEEILPSTKSLKSELQAAYKRAEAACLKDPKCRAKMAK